MAGGLDHSGSVRRYDFAGERLIAAGEPLFRTLNSIAVLGLISAFRMFFICRREYSVSSIVFEATQSAGTHNL
jgi:hypothetical protein